jgi:ATP-dependent helicase HrpA
MARRIRGVRSDRGEAPERHNGFVKLVGAEFRPDFRLRLAPERQQLLHRLLTLWSQAADPAIAVLGRSRLERALQENFLSIVRLREWADVHRQLLEQCKESSVRLGKRSVQLDPIEEVPPNTSSSKTSPSNSTSQAKWNSGYANGYDQLHLSLLAGMLSGIGMMEDTGKYRGAQNLEMALWPGSGIRQTKPKWIVSAERIETTQRYARTAAKIEVEWIERVATHLIKYAYDDAHFSRKQGSALVMRRCSLLGLPVAPRIAVPLAPLNPELARSLLIEHGLAEGELVSRAKFWDHNIKLMGHHSLPLPPREQQVPLVIQVKWIGRQRLLLLYLV